MTAPLPQQANAVETAVRIIAGGMKPASSGKAHIVERLKEAADTLRWLERNERKVRAAISGEAA